MEIFRTFVRQSKLRWIVLLEIAIFLGVAAFIDHYLMDGTQYYYIEPHPYWILVLLISVLYGARHGVLSAIAASAVFLWGNIPGQALNQDMYEWFFAAFKLPILWTITAMIVGKISARHILTRIELTKQLHESGRRQDTLMDSFQQIKASKETMEIRIAGQRSTIHRVLAAARDMQGLEPIQILERAQDLLKAMLEPDKFSIYVLQDNRLHMAFENGWDEADNYGHSFGPDDKLFESIVEGKNVLCIVNPGDEVVLSGHAVLAAPLVIPNTGEVFGMLKIEKLHFSRLSRNTITELEIVSEWIGSLYGKTPQYPSYKKVVPLCANDTLQ